MANLKNQNQDFLIFSKWLISSVLLAVVVGCLSALLSNSSSSTPILITSTAYGIAMVLCGIGLFVISKSLENNNKLNRGFLSQRQRLIILGTLESYISKRLKDSLYGRGDSLYTSDPIELTIQEDLEKVGRDQRRRESPEPISASQLLDLLERTDIKGRILILGEPGAGKTTTLLALAGELIQKAKETPTDSIPVLLELSRLKSNSFKEWLIDEIKRETGLDVEFEVLRSGQFIPLLDGLDELSPENQINAIKEINEVLSENPLLPLIVCCRSKVYNSYNQESLLDCLNGAVIIQPMSNDQIQAYLNNINPDIWDEIQKIADLQKFFKPSEIDEDDVLEAISRQVDKDIENFLRTPLFLDLIPAIWDKSFRIQSQEELIEAYVNQCLSVDAVSSGRREKSKKKSIWGRKKIPPKEKAQIYLSFLAKNMRQNKTIEFTLRDISPRWLEVPYAFDLYNCVSFFGAFTLSILTLSFILNLYLFCLGRLLPIEWNVIGMTISAIFSLPFALALFQDLSATHPDRKIIFFNRKDLEKIKPSLDNLTKLARIFIFILLHLIPVYLIAFLYFTHWENLAEYVSSLSPNHQITSTLVIVFLILFLLGFPSQLLRAILLWSGQRRRKVRLRKRPWMERSSTRIGSFLGFVLDSLLYGFRFPLFLAAVLFAVGVLLCIYFFVISIVLALLVLLLSPPNLELLPWIFEDIDLASNYLVFFHAKGLIVLVLMTGYVAISIFVWMQLINQFIERVEEGKNSRTFYFFYENQDEEWMNSNSLSFLWESIFCFFAVSVSFSTLLLAGFFIGGLFLDVYGSESHVHRDWTFITWFVWLWGLPIGLPIGFFIGFWLTLFPVVRYFTLWFVLAKFNLIPFRYINFLDYAVERKILQKTDGRYRFIHQLFLEYFADKESATESIFD